MTDKIIEEVEKIKQDMKNLPRPEPISKKELETAIKKLKKGKACRPDKIPNETILKMNHESKDP